MKLSEAELEEHYGKQELQDAREMASTSFGRHRQRVAHFLGTKKEYTALWLIHNCLAHPLLGLFPSQYTVDFHRITSNWINQKRIHQEVPERTSAWVFHNCISHPLIGFFPKKWAFEHHDETAERMGLEDWV